MNQVGWYVIVVLAILLVGGFFSGAEMALVSLREGQVRSLAQRGKRGQRAAKLAQDPNRFLSAVQIGVTVATLLSGAFGAASLAAAMKSALIEHSVSSAWAWSSCYATSIGSICRTLGRRPESQAATRGPGA